MGHRHPGADPQQLLLRIHPDAGDLSTLAFSSSWNTCYQSLTLALLLTVVNIIYKLSHRWCVIPPLYLPQVLGGRLAEMYGTRVVFGGCILSSAILTLLTPMAAHWSSNAVIAVRVLLGLASVGVPGTVKEKRTNHLHLYDPCVYFWIP